jgi:GMP synthase-like glutamine amidotransferase
MRIHHLQHVPFEGLGSIEAVLKDKGHLLSSTHLYKSHALPDVNSFDWLIIMGGPMGIYEYDQFTWLKEEKSFIGKVIESGKIVLGICLGAQIIADVLGAKVYKNRHKEIGWFDISATPEINDTILANSLAPILEAFHWHGDTFDLPAGALNIASSDACKNQGFILDVRILALQFHLETTWESATALIENGRSELNGSKYVQSEKEILAIPSRFSCINQAMEKVLEALEKKRTNEI